MKQLYIFRLTFFETKHLFLGLNILPIYLKMILENIY